MIPMSTHNEPCALCGNHHEAGTVVCRVRRPTLTLVHLTTHEEHDVEVVSYYPPAYLMMKWGELSGLYGVDLRKDGVVKGIRDWRLKDLRQAHEVYAKLADAKRVEIDRTIRPDDLAALQHWKDKGLL